MSWALKAWVGLHVHSAFSLDALCRPGPFRMLSQNEFGALLGGLAEKQVLTQVSDGSLTLGIVGERLVDHYSFYAAFQTPEEYRLVAR